jgi:hypothetical protein
MLCSIFLYCSCSCFSYSSGNHSAFHVDIDESSATLKIKAVFTDLLKPYPAEITQLDQQLVLFEGNHYFLSPYPTTSQKSVFKLASSNIESFTKLSPHSTRGGSIHFGPYQSIASFSVRGHILMFAFLLFLFLSFFACLFISLVF